MTYGYVRVSTKEQNEDRQLVAMATYGVPPENVYVDKQSGKDFDRPAYRNLVSLLSRGDVLVVLSIDRLGRNYDDVLEQWRRLTKDVGVDVVVLDMPLLDTRQAKDLLGTFISDLVLQLLSFVAETERDNIRRRQAEGIAAAKARGVKFGRPPKPLPVEFETVCNQWYAGKLTGVEAANRCKMPLSTFRYRAKKLMTEQNGNRAEQICETSKKAI